MGEILSTMGILRYRFITLVRHSIEYIPTIYAFIFDNKLTGIWIGVQVGIFTIRIYYRHMQYFYWYKQIN